MRSLGVVPGYPLADGGLSLLEIIEVMEPNTLLLHGSEQSLDHAVLLRRMRRDELLLYAVAADRYCETARGENQSVVRA